MLNEWMGFRIKYNITENYYISLLMEKPALKNIKSLVDFKGLSSAFDSLKENELQAKYQFIRPLDYQCLSKLPSSSVRTMEGEAIF